jgi:hypothetical protein
MTQSELDKLLANIKSKQKVVTATVVATKVKAKPKKVSVNKKADKITALLDANKIPYITEHRFCEERKFRFDFVVLPMSRKLAIEYEGLMSAKSRHTTITGFSTDCTKYNLAATKGWVVLRYTALNYTEMISDLTKMFTK